METVSKAPGRVSARRSWLPSFRLYIGGAVLRFFGWNANFLMMLALAWMAMGVLEMPSLREAVQVDR